MALPAEDLSRDKLLADLPRDADGRPLLGGIPILRRIGKGGMGAVYYGLHPRLRVEVAVKILPFHLIEQDAKLVDRFISEARMAASIASDHLVRVLDVNHEHDTHYLVMEYVAGESAGGFLKRVKSEGRAALDEGEALQIVIAATKGLAAAHEQGIIHRDIKPDNILIPKGILKRAKLADLGLAKPEGGGQSVGTQSHVAMGTPGYMAPEQAEDAKTAGQPADVFSMGATLYALLSGNAPFCGTSLAVILRDTAIKEPPPLPAHVSAEVRGLVARCLSKDPHSRFASGLVLLDVLEGLSVPLSPAKQLPPTLKETPPPYAETATPVTAPARTLVTLPHAPSPPLSPRRRSLLPRYLMGACLVALVGVAVLGWFLIRGFFYLAEVDAPGKDAPRPTAQQPAANTPRPTDLSARIDKALQQRRAGDISGMQATVAEALDECKRDLARDSRSAEPHYALGRLYAVRMDFSEALAEQETAVRIDPTHAAAQYEKAVLRMHISIYNWRSGEDRRLVAAIMGVVATSLQAHRDALPPPDLAYANAMTCFSRDRSSDAGVHLRKLIQENPRHVEAIEFLAWLLEGDRKHDEALQWWTQAIASDRGYWPFRQGRAHALLAQVESDVAQGKGSREQLDRAMMDVNEALQAHSTDFSLLALRARINLAMAIERRHAGEDPVPVLTAARTDWEQSIRAKPDSADLHLGLGRTLACLGKDSAARGQDPSLYYAAALNSLDRALALEPTNWRVLVQRGQTRMSQGDVAGALNDADKALARCADAVDALALRATARLRTGDSEGAARDASAAIMLTPADGTLYCTRASALSRLGRIAEALASMDTAVTLMPGDARVWTFRGSIHESLGDAARAIADYKKALLLNPADRATLEARIARLQK